jgi:hypothetical protein
MLHLTARRHIDAILVDKRHGSCVCKIATATLEPSTLDYTCVCALRAIMYTQTDNRIARRAHPCNHVLYRTVVALLTYVSDVTHEANALYACTFAV